MSEILLKTFSKKKAQVVSDLPSINDLLTSAYIGKELSSYDGPFDFDDQYCIDWKSDGELPMRVVSRSNYDGQRGYFPSKKPKRVKQFASLNELAVFRLLEVNPLVRVFQEQPTVVTYNDFDGSKRKHIPDVLVTLTNGTKVLFEVKSERFVSDPEILDRTKRMKSIFFMKGICYFTLFPSQWKSQSYLENAIELIRHSTSAYPDGFWEKVRRYMAVQKKTTLKDLIIFLDDPHARGWIYQLIMSGDLYCNQSELLCGDTEISWDSNRGQ